MLWYPEEGPVPDVAEAVNPDKGVVAGDRIGPSWLDHPKAFWERTGCVAILLVSLLMLWGFGWAVYEVTH